MAHKRLDNFVWHLENYFKSNKVNNDENKINTTMLYLSEMVMLWWKLLMKGVCNINTCETL